MKRANSSEHGEQKDKAQNNTHLGQANNDGNTSVSAASVTVFNVMQKDMQMTSDDTRELKDNAWKSSDTGEQKDKAQKNDKAKKNLDRKRDIKI